MTPLPAAPFGRTGHVSTRAVFGAAALFGVDQDVADRTMDLVAERGVNHIDVAASYGKAEQRLGPWLGRNRTSVFLATKTEKRTRDGAREELMRSLDLLRVDSVDLWQMHVLVDAEGWERAMGAGGALEAFVEARDEGLVKWLGVTGHGLDAPTMHLRSLERFDFDSVLLPWNWTMGRNPEYAAGFRRLRETCRRRNVAIQMIKTACRGPWPVGAPRNRTTWYEPFSDEGDLAASVHWSLGIEEAFLNTPADVGLLPNVLDAVAGYRTPPSDEEMAERAEKGGWTELFP